MAPAASPSDWYNSLPPVCKAWGTACFACTLFSQFGLVDLRNLYLDWALVSSKFHVWRLLTNFCFLGKFSFPFLMRMMMMCVLPGTCRTRAPRDPSVGRNVKSRASSPPLAYV